MPEVSSSSDHSVGVFFRAFREPEAFSLHWHNAGQPYQPVIFLLLAGVAVLGTAAYGTLLGIPGSPTRVLECSLLFASAAALSWAAPLPAVYILNSLSGSRLRFSTTFLAALLTAGWGGFGFLALLPVTALVLMSISNQWAILAVHLTVFAVVGVCMAVLYDRLQTGLEPQRGAGRSWWLWLFVLLQVELLYAFGLVKFPMTP